MGKYRSVKWWFIAGLLGAISFVSGCTVVPEGEEGGGIDWIFIGFIVVIFVAFYFLLIRPQQRRQKQHQKLVEELKRGDMVVTAGGIYGRIENVGDDSVVLKVESGATIRVARSSVSRKRGE